MLNNIPNELKVIPNWVVANKDKVPFDPKTKRQASPTNKETWGTFEQASKAGFPNIGFVLEEHLGYAIIDLDNKPHAPCTPEQQARHNKIYEHVVSYTERSTSGTGIHIVVRGQVPTGVHRDNVEIYSDARYMIFTGDVIRNLPINDCQQMLNLLYGEMQPPKVATLDEHDAEMSDGDLVEMAMNAINADKFNRLCRGEWQGQAEYPSQSEADFALLSILAFYTPSNAQVRRIFRMTELGKREKAVRNDRYLNHSLERIRGNELPLVDMSQLVANAATATSSAFATDHRNSALLLPPPSRLRLVGANEIGGRPPMKWLVRGILPEKGIGAIYGPPGSGKSFLILDLLAKIAEGSYWFGIPTKSAPVVYIALEGQAGMPQRINAYKAKGGALDRVSFIEQQIDLQNPADRREIVGVIRNAGLGGGVVCIDTLAASSPGMDENTSADMGAVIAGLQELQSELGGLVLVVHHTGKDVGRGLRGWSGLNGALDCAIETSRISEKKDDARRRWGVTKSKDGRDGLSGEFVLEEVQLGHDDDGFFVSSCVVGHLVKGEKDSGSATSAEDDEFIWQWLKDQVASGKYPSKNSIKGQLDDMKAIQPITQKRVTDAIERLMAATRVRIAATLSPAYNKWLEAVEPTDPSIPESEGSEP